MKRLVLAVAAVAVLAAPAAQVSAWGSTGHRLVGMAAIRALPDELPAFLRTPGAVADIGELAREPDRWKGAGQPHDRERDTAHFVDMDDAGRVMNASGPAIDALPRLKSEYDAALIAAGTNVNDAGYLPYAIMDGWQQVVRDFAYIRVLNAAEARETNPERRAWYRVDRERREALTLRDIGVLAHYVGDASQPHHTTIHYNGWDRNTPNPEGFTTSRQTHSDFENAFTSRVARLDMVEAAMPAFSDRAVDMNGRIATYLRTTLTQVTPFYRLQKAGAFRDTDARGAEFVTARLGAGAAELRDLIVLAWRASGETTIGWPAIKVAEVEAGTIDPWLSMIGDD
ncbi:MAG TPA: S1/P1 Nuclease [Brevundimonas sp.]|uniref:S1/P1 Nuclease n=1 Tax=Brevundimonas sp. TaxID=1871086 RepID=UPI0026223382|nr:S1/P1 Nuclease [Brevundimonas sp.]HRO33669.1 S1/P1 Nuclease [Brevundimonas sp.]